MTAGGGKRLSAKNPDNYATILFYKYFHRRDPQLMLREKFWLLLTGDQTQTFASWVDTVKEKVAGCKFPADFYQEAVRDQLSAFSCKEDSYKLKIYGERAALPLDSVKISLKEATKHELQESKTAEIESVRKSGIDVDKEGNKQDLKSQFLRTNDNFPVVFNEKDWATFEIARLKNLQSRNE